MLLLLQVVENILLLSFLGLGYFLVERYGPATDSVVANLLKGLCFGLTAALVTAAPVALTDGATVDARAGPVILAGVAAGPLGGLVAAVMGAAARGLVGGSFAFSGVAVYFVYALLGVLIRRTRLVDLQRTPTIGSVSVLVFASYLGAAAMFLLIQPSSRAWLWLEEDLPLIVFANTLAIAYSAVVIGIAANIQKTSADLAKMNQSLNLAKRAGRFGVWDYDLRTRELVWDNHSMQLHGVDPDEFGGTFEDWSRNVHPDDYEQAIEAFNAAISENRMFDAEYRVRTPDGKLNWVKGDAIVLRDARGEAIRVVGSNVDLTDIRLAQSDLAEARDMAAKAHKFETIGQMTGGVAHDFNNLLAVIMGNLELLQHQLDAAPLSREKAADLISASIEAAARGAELTQNMLAYARRARLTPVQVDLNAVVRETQEWMRRTIETSVDIEIDLAPGLWPMMADKGSLQSALINLLVNARDAIDGAGKVTIQTRNVTLECDTVVHGDERMPPGRYVTLVVADDGPGISDDVIARVFDPFFTTKEVGKGSGLGLSMVHGFVKQSAGAIQVHSEPGDGTRFVLYFPGAEEADKVQVLADNRDDAGSTRATAKHGGRILLVEDQEEVKRVLRQLLEGGGFDVVETASGEQALDVFSSDARFDLVVTDIVMPGELQGAAMAQAIRARRPDMRFVYLSGYAGELPGENIEGDADIRLMKPVSRADLLSAVQRALS